MKAETGWCGRRGSVGARPCQTGDSQLSSFVSPPGGDGAWCQGALPPGNPPRARRSATGGSRRASARRARPGTGRGSSARAWRHLQRDRAGLGSTVLDEVPLRWLPAGNEGHSPSHSPGAQPSPRPVRPAARFLATRPAGRPPNQRHPFGPRPLRHQLVGHLDLQALDLLLTVRDPAWSPILVIGYPQGRDSRPAFRITASHTVVLADPAVSLSRVDDIEQRAAGGRADHRTGLRRGQDAGVRTGPATRVRVASKDQQHIVGLPPAARLPIKAGLSLVG